jgi:hypothetical protein
MSRSLLLVAALLVVPSIATAGSSKAWNAAKKVHPDAPIIAGIDVKSAKDSEMFKKFFPILLEKKKDAKDVLDRLQKECAFDPFTAVNSVVAVIDDNAGGNKGAFYIALNAGWNAKTVGECAQKIAKTEKKELKVGAVKKNLQEMEMVGKSERIYLGWLGKDVLVIATEPTDKTFAEAMITGKGKGEAAKLAKKLDTGATVWMAVIKEQSIQKGIDMKALYGTVKLAKANLAADARIVTGGKDQAESLVTAFNTEIPKMAGSLPAAAQLMVKNMKMKAAGAEVQASTNAPEKDVMDLLQMLMAFM